MRRFFSRNIDNIGRVLRGAWALACFVGAWFAFGAWTWLGILLVAFGLLALFEALRGWCLMRACGIKTKY